jgi:3-dehydroquinate synthase
MTSAQFIDHMLVDKKVLGGQLRLVLLKEVGEAIVTSDFSPSLLEETLSAGKQLGQCC